MEPTQVVVKGTVEYVRSCCEASLKRLGVDYIDLYYLHWIYTSGPIEETLALPRFTGQNLDHNKIFYLRIEELSKKHSCTLVQLALAWVLHQGDDTLVVALVCCLNNIVATAAETCACLDVFRRCQVRDIQVLS
ncbi:hypothetical protein HYC85_016307 [Camellia sinensis]|uniref:NADP-dependent oxidoreductase domain-containing protein n=1 Tax=Camellia sinensis TaxID=4442 RepID=A0A7J7GZC6_CAMSI|nr:hypothetical protein HYC85_016307 [Camellia sinensis]